MSTRTEPQSTVGSPAVLTVLLFASTLGVMGGAIIVPVLEVIRGDLGVSGTAAGLIITSHGLAIAVSSPLMGRLVDRWGVRGLMVAGLVLYGLAGGAGLITTSYPALIVSRLTFGIGAAAVFTATTVALLALYQGAVRDKVMGWRSTATSVGGLVWPLLSGVLGGISWHATFAIYLVGIPLALASLRYLPDTRDGTRERDGGVLRMLRERPALLGYYAFLISFAIMGYVLAVFLPQRLAEIGIDSPLLVSLYAVVIGAVLTSLVGLAYARIRRFLGYAALLRLAAAGWVGAFLLFGTVNDPVLLLLAPVLLGLANGIVFPVATVLIDRHAGPRLRGRAASLSGTAIFAGQFSSPLLIGPLIDATTTTTGFLAAAGIATVILLVLLAVKISGADPAPAE
ncbi:MFS transporter [Amycolatopsis cihanbeyliensis]|uniref:Putative MFS family arabinose efflux permease n=1 Tax=Amycolatopsis cihanbeyliensis TaxID=1128664 RepID=A0A542DI89_AMYCI|nr:MFS transporter [Amycolatopsis cihanbeyliensis]TQJ02809.1 putative MFS family arabinose efflux permease [Amycolatopsis cihanbeyliensis]